MSVQSLHDFLAQSGAASRILSVSPSTFKALTSSIVDLLIEQRSPALVWAKLPRGASWQIDVDRLDELSSTLSGLYRFSNTIDDMVEAKTVEAKTVEAKTLDASRSEDLGTIAAHPPAEDQTFPTEALIQPEHCLRREFFLAVYSADFCVLITAQRGKKLDVEESTGAIEESVDRKVPLAVGFTFSPTSVQQGVLHLKALLGQGCELSGHLSAQTWVQQWRDNLTQIAAPTTALSPLSFLFSQQIQRQEDLWQRSLVHRKQAEQVNFLQLQNEELISNVRQKDEFLSTVGQQLRTPLTNMKTALTLLNSPNLKPTQRQRYMDLLVQECDRQSSLIGSLLDLVSLDQMAERLTLQPISIAEIVPSAVTSYQPLAHDKSVQLFCTVPENLPPIACLEPWLRQIITSLMHNGIKFTQQGGEVAVRAKQQGDFVQLEVKDTGIGIPVQEIPRLFDRFYRVRQSNGQDYGGAGLGLAIAQQLLLRCGGSISVKSRPGEGSIFSVMLPVYQVRDRSEEL